MKNIPTEELSTAQLETHIDTHEMLLNKMIALAAIIPDCSPELLTRHTEEISRQELKCKELSTEHFRSKHSNIQKKEKAMYQTLFNLMKAIDDQNHHISKILKAKTAITTEELKNLKKTMPSIASYANTQHITSHPILNQQG